VKRQALRADLVTETLVENVPVFDHRDPPVDVYSDGDIEDEILAYVRSGREPEAVLAEDNRWPVLYHLSPIRRNLLEWYRFPRAGSLVEVGAGCGSLTGLFCERVRRVTAVELSLRRATVIATRLRAFRNLEIHVGNLANIGLSETFDVATLVGVLEYSPKYFVGDDPPLALLRHVRRLVKPGGALLLAIENRFGLKYWAGAPEDHTGGFFDGLEGYSVRRDVRTWGKAELEGLLREGGFPEMRFFYPLPDYKLPDRILSDDWLPKPGDLPEAAPSYDQDRIRLFDEGRVAEGLVANGLFPHMAPSFLVEAR
jgi:SAM-dependent methyltransferase